jgi:hypothetical protein
MDYVFRNLLSDLPCSQIWLNLPADYRHFGYITNLMKKNHCLGHEAGWCVTMA